MPTPVVSNEMVAGFAASHLPWRLDVSRDAGLQHRTVEFGDLWAVNCRLGGMVGRRDLREIRRTQDEYLAVLLVRQGTEVFTQRGRRAEVGAGTAVVWDGVQPGECFSAGRLVKTTFFLPRELGRETLPRFDSIVGRPLPDSPSLRLLFSWLRTSMGTGELDEAAATTAGHVAVDLLTSAIGASSSMVLDTRAVRLMELARLYLSGQLSVELTPQGTLAERLRAGGTGIPAFYTPIGVGTMVADGGIPVHYDADGNVVETSAPKEIREFDGRQYVLETALTADFGLVRAAVGGRHGNLVFSESARNSNPLAGMAGRVTIAEVETLVEPGEIRPEDVHLPGVFVDRVVVVGPEGKGIENRTTRPRTDRSAAPAAAGEEATTDTNGEAPSR